MTVSLSPRHKFAEALILAQDIGSWTAYASYMDGEPDTGDSELDKAIRSLNVASEAVHLRANQLSMLYELPFFNGS